MKNKQSRGSLHVIYSEGSPRMHPTLFIDIHSNLSLKDKVKIRKHLFKKYPKLSITFKYLEGKDKTVALVESPEVLTEKEKIPVAAHIHELLNK